MAEAWTVPLPSDVTEPFEVFVNGVPQVEGRDFEVEGRVLHFMKPLAKEGRLGLLRWASMFLGVAGTYRKNDSVDVVFQAFHRFLGVAVGEHLGYLFTGAWTVLVGAAFAQASEGPAWLGLAGIAVGAVLALCSLEFVGPAERDGWRLAGAVTPVVYVAWSVWLIGVGVALIA